MERLGEQVKGLHAPSHIDIPGNSRANHLADVGRRKPPILFGQISVHPRRQEEPEEEEGEEDPIEVREGVGAGGRTSCFAICGIRVW